MLHKLCLIILLDVFRLYYLIFVSCLRRSGLVWASVHIIFYILVSIVHSNVRRHYHAELLSSISLGATFDCRVLFGGIGR